MMNKLHHFEKKVDDEVDYIYFFWFFVSLTAYIL